MSLSSYDPHKNNLVQISLTSVVLGVCIGSGIVFRTKLMVYYGIVAAFHLLEFIAISRYSKRTVTQDSFLVWNNKGSAEYWVMQTLSAMEWLISRRKNVVASSMGVFMVVCGVLIRMAAIRDLGQSFSHYIQRSSVQPLVTTGVFAWARHPSYLGFYLYCIGVQMYLNNWVMMGVCLVVMKVFFGRRIRYEEDVLEGMYGEYGEYKRRVRVWIP